MQPGRPAQHRFRQRVFQSPVGFDLFQQLHGGRFDAVRLHGIDVIAQFHGAHAAHPGVLVGESPHQVVQQPLAHGAFRDPDPVDAEVVDDFQQDREAARGVSADSKG